MYCTSYVVHAVDVYRRPMRYYCIRKRIINSSPLTLTTSQWSHCAAFGFWREGASGSIITAQQRRHFKTDNLVNSIEAYYSRIKSTGK